MSHSETNKPQATACEEYTAAVITVSDRCSRGEREDASGPALVALLGERGYRVVSTLVVPDERPQIEAAIRDAAAADVALVLTTGGTGFSPRDVTPEATATVCERMAPGIPEAMRAASMAITLPLARGGGHPGRNACCESAGEPQGCVREHLGGYWAHSTRAAHPARRPRRLRGRAPLVTAPLPLPPAPRPRLVFPASPSLSVSVKRSQRLPSC